MAGPPQVSASAELDRRLRAGGARGLGLQLLHGHADADDPHGVGVRLVEDRPQSLDRFGDGERRLFGKHLLVFGDELVGGDLDGLHLLGGERLLGREVEAHSVRGDEAALLVSVRREHLPQGVVEHVRARVVVHHTLPPRLVHLELRYG